MSMYGNENMRRGDIKITGNGTSGGGLFNQVKIMGDALINGDTDSKLFKCMGNAEIKGSLISETTSINGSLRVRGLLQGASFKIQGDAQVSKDYLVKESTVNGDLAVGGRIEAESVKVNGGFHAAACQTEELHLRGSAEVEGMLNGEVVRLKLYGSSRVRELVGGTIIVKKGMGVPLLGMFTHQGGSLTAESIEGDIVELENTTADVVRGRRVTIGSGCKIGLVEYIEDFNQDEGAIVSKRVELK